jgi:uncharacterized membrane protein
MNVNVLDRPNVGLRRILVVSFAIAAVITFGLVGPQLSHFLAAASLGRSLHRPDWALLLTQPLALQIHVVAALGAVGLGAVLMVVRKGKTFHRIGGWAWSALLMTVALSSLFLFNSTGTWSFLHLFSGWVIVFLPLAILFARLHQTARHRMLMRVLFYGSLLISGALAFLPGRLMWQLFFA